MDLCICNTKWTLGEGIQEINGASETLCVKRGAWYVKGWPPLLYTIRRTTVSIIKFDSVVEKTPIKSGGKYFVA